MRLATMLAAICSLALVSCTPSGGDSPAGSSNGDQNQEQSDTSNEDDGGQDDDEGPIDPNNIPFVPDRDDDRPRPEITILAEHYDLACERHLDCQLIFEGDYCGCRLCNNAAIASSSANEFREDVAAAEEKCGELDISCGSLEPQTVTHPQASTCSEVYAFCLESTCTAIHANDLRELPAECDSDDDCVLVPWSMGRDCDCQSATNHLGYYLATEIRDRNGFEQAPPGSCDCDDAGPARCLNRRCYRNDGGAAGECPITAWDPASCK